METEFEAKFLNIDKEAIRQKLKNFGASLVYEEKLMRCQIFEPANNKNNSWIIVRDEGDKTTLLYKETIGDGFHSTKEINLKVNDFDKACAVFELLELKPKALQESKRELWNYEAAEITIDTWPWLKPFIEIEGPTENSIERAIELLGLSWSQALYGPVSEVYKQYFKVTDEEVNNCSLRFSAQAPWPALPYKI